MIGIVGVGDSFYASHPPGRGHRDTEMIQCRPATDDGLASCTIGPRDASGAVQIQVQIARTGPEVDDPAPWLGVVQRRCTAGKLDGGLDDVDVNHGLGHVGSARLVVMSTLGELPARGQGPWSPDRCPKSPLWRGAERHRAPRAEELVTSVPRIGGP
ncbi:Uncharacterised protein [Mycobacteroides abscessus subsp. abscessus]|nr:Uncharacterised protein [Mycobacteroides abscessus subsp. abscessus]